MSQGTALDAEPAILLGHTPATPQIPIINYKYPAIIFVWSIHTRYHLACQLCIATLQWGHVSNMVSEIINDLIVFQLYI